MSSLYINEKIRGLNNWPPEKIRKRWEEISRSRNFYYGEGSDLSYSYHSYTNSVPDGGLVSLPKMLSKTSANMLFGEDFTYSISSDSDDDNDQVKEIILKNDLQGESKQAAESISRDGGGFIVASLNPEISDRPVINYFLEDQVLPEFDGKGNLIKAGIITRYKVNKQCYRLIEWHTAGQIEYRLHSGTERNLGREVPLTTIEETSHLPDTPELTGIDDILVDYIPNYKTLDSDFGHSDYEGLEKLFVYFSESIDLTQDILRNTVPWVFVDDKLVDHEGNLPGGANIVQVSNLDADVSDKPLVETIQHKFSSKEYLEYQRNMLDLILLLAGTSPSALGVDVEGGVISGTALRLKMNNTLNNLRGKAQYFERSLSRMLELAVKLDAINGTGYSENVEDIKIQVKLGDGLPDEKMTVQEISSAVSSGLMSAFTAIKNLHPEWTDDQVSQELDRIKEDLNQEKTISNLMSNLLIQ